MLGVIEYLVASIIGISNMILWGLYGDLMVEDFKLFKVLRSLFLGLFFGSLLYYLNPSLPLFIVAISTIALERLFTEIYKALFRKENQDKYKIPSDLNIKINIVYKRTFGILLLGVVVLSLCFYDFHINRFLIIVIAGILGATGGALKDASFEGFSLKKFVRTPIVSIICGIIIYTFFPSVKGKYFLISVFGFERIVSEFYKKIYKGRIPGKFKEDSNKNLLWQRKREKLLYLYAADIIALLILMLCFNPR